jgi:tetratricopeptide (TPR) repeat protein
MQNYINPIELLNLNKDLTSGFDGLTIRKAKKVLLAEIELSDTETTIHNGIELTKSDCLRAIDELDNKDKKDFHLFIFQNRDLNNFLSNGDLSFFNNYKVESIYKLPEFIDFVSPYFAQQYEKALSKNYKFNKLNNVRKLISVKPIVNEAYIEECFKSTYAVVKEIEKEIIELTKEIENKNSKYIENNFEDFPDLINEKINIDSLNLLPAFFQSLRNQLAQTIRNLARDLNNDPYNEYETAFRIIEIANNIITDGLINQTIIKGYYTIKKNYEDSLPKKINSTGRQQPSTPKKTLVEIEDDDDELSTLDKKAKNNNITYWLFVSVAYTIGFFYNPVQKIILGVSLLILSFPPILSRKNNNFSLGLYLKKNIFLILAATLGFIYSIIAELYIAYSFLANLNDIYDNLTKKDKEEKSKFGIYHYLAGAMIITFLYQNYSTTNAISSDIEADTTNSSNIEDNIIQEELTAEEYFQKGNSFYSKSDFNAAIIHYNKAININPNYPEPYSERGASNTYLGQYEAAISDFEKAEQLGMKSSNLYSNWGFTYYKLKQPEKAIPLFDKAISIDPKNSHPYRWLGEIKYDKNDDKGAEEYYTKAINLNPNSSNHFARGLAYYYLKDYKKAIQDMDKAIQLNPNAGQYYYDRGDAKDMIKDYVGACIDWKVAKEKGYSVPENKINRCTPQIVYISNGELIGCNEIKPKYNRNIDNKLLITVGSNASVAVKLIDKANEKCIRYVFINKNTTYSIRNIPEGKYYLKIAYGNEWITMNGQPNCTGKFTKNTYFEKGKETLDYNLVYSGNNYQVPSFSLNLDIKISEGKMNDFNTDKISENEFHNE